MYKGEGPTDGSTSETNITIPSGTGDLRTGLFDSNGQAHIDHDGYEYLNPIWCGYKGYQVRLSPHTPTGSYAGRFAKRREPLCDSCESLLQAAQGCWGDQYDLQQQPKINGFGLAVGEWSLLTLRLERTAPGTVVFTATLNDVTYTYTDDEPANQPQMIDEMAMYFPNDRPFDLVSLDFVRCSDLDESGLVDFNDLGYFLADNWLWSGEPGGNNIADFDGDGMVNFYDFALFAVPWMDSCP